MEKLEKLRAMRDTVVEELAAKAAGSAATNSRVHAEGELWGGERGGTRTRTRSSRMHSAHTHTHARARAHSRHARTRAHTHAHPAVR
eukprot:5931445-Prymnesium_polylepis.1